LEWVWRKGEERAANIEALIARLEGEFLLYLALVVSPELNEVSLH
jgi:hypothetical protein